MNVYASEVQPAMRSLARRVLLVVLVAVSGSLGAAGIASAQYGSGTPLPPVPPVQGVSDTPGAGTTDGSTTSDVPGAVGGGEAEPVEDTTGDVRDTGVESAPTVQVRSSDVAQPVAASPDSLPFTGARIGALVALGAFLLLLGVGIRRRFAAPPMA